MGSRLAESLAVVARTDPGLIRSHNEDAIFGDAQRGLVILADGMGGYNAGEVASSMATALLSADLEAALAALAAERPTTEARPSAASIIRDCIARANAAIFNAAASEPAYAGMGTTLLLALFHDNRVTVAHIGDSRLYRLRNHVFAQLTRDHSLLQEQIDAGMITAEEARHSQHRNLVTRALGVEPQVEAEVHDYDVLPGDIYLLCSDGLNDMVGDREIALTLHAPGMNPEQAATQLIRMANDAGGRDNVSVILVKVLHEFPAASGWWARLINCFK